MKEKPRGCGWRVRPKSRRPHTLWMGLYAAGIALGNRAEADTVNRIVAVVNDDIITNADVSAQVNAMLDGANDQGGGAADPTQIGQAVLRRLIEQRLMLQEAKKAAITVTSEEIATQIDALRARLGTEEAFQRFLTEAGMSAEQLKERIRDQLMVKQLIDTKVRTGITVSLQEVAQELAEHPELAKPGDRVRALHILVRVNANRPEERARAMITRVRRQLVDGADFASLAKQFSEDPYAERGGQMGWVAQGDLLPELDAALFGLQPGTMSDPIQTRLGFHLLKVEERREASGLSLMEANRAIYERLYQQKFQQAMNRWLGDLKRKAYIEIPEGSRRSSVDSDTPARVVTSR